MVVTSDFYPPVVDGALGDIAEQAIGIIDVQLVEQGQCELAEPHKFHDRFVNLILVRCAVELVELCDCSPRRRHQGQANTTGAAESFQVLVYEEVEAVLPEISAWYGYDCER